MSAGQACIVITRYSTHPPLEDLPADIVDWLWYNIDTEELRRRGWSYSEDPASGVIRICRRETTPVKDPGAPGTHSRQPGENQDPAPPRNHSRNPPGTEHPSTRKTRHAEHPSNPRRDICDPRRI